MTREEFVIVALENKHSETELIGNLHEFFIAKDLMKTFYKLYKGFKKSAKKIYKEYAYNKKKNLPTEQLLIDYLILCKCRDYYCVEWNQCYDTIIEYIKYVFKGNLINTLLGQQRLDDKYIAFKAQKNEY